MSKTADMWTRPEPPEWLATMNNEGSFLNLSAAVPLDEDSLLGHACKTTGLSDLGGDEWREPFRVLIDSLENEAELTLMGRLMARNDVMMWLSNRLQVIDTLKQHPEIHDEEIVAPMVVVGLPRTGTSILFEVLAQDPDAAPPLNWEGLLPIPPPEAATYESDPRIEIADHLYGQWSRVAPSFASMHEMRGTTPAECGLLMVGTFISDYIAALHQTVSYSAWCAQADHLPVYQWHRDMLKILQWKNPRKRWLLKAPEHQVHLDTLLAVYPDARIVHTHRDPLKSMSSATSIMGTFYSMRSDQPFNAEMFENIMMGEATARRLEAVMELRDRGVIPRANIVDSRYQDLMEDPVACIEKVYRHFGMTFSEKAKQRMLRYLATKPKGKFGAHKYDQSGTRAKDRPLFQRYQERYGVPDEV